MGLTYSLLHRGRICSLVKLILLALKSRLLHLIKWQPRNMSAEKKLFPQTMFQVYRFDFSGPSETDSGLVAWSSTVACMSRQDENLCYSPDPVLVSFSIVEIPFWFPVINSAAHGHISIVFSSQRGQSQGASVKAKVAPCAYCTMQKFTYIHTHTTYILIRVVRKGNKYLLQLAILL